MGNFAISNLAFKDNDFSKTLSYLCKTPIEALEIAPTLIWKEPDLVPKIERQKFKDLVSSYGLSIIALQSLLFGKPELQLFGSPKSQKILLAYLKEMINLCSELGGRIVSFGAPRNRLKGELNLNEAISHASGFFFSLAEYAQSIDINVCVEPISSVYECDFINDTEQAILLINKVGHPNFNLLLDTGNLIFNKEDYEAVIRKHINQTAHIHINDPKLFPPSEGIGEHSIIAKTLKEVGYSGWLTLEFTDYHTSLEKDISYGIACYGSP